MKLARHVARMGEKRGAYRDSVERYEGNKPFGKPRRKWVDNIKLELKETGLPGVVWIDLAQEIAACFKDGIEKFGVSANFLTK
jgi:hypothetical protein